MEDEKLELKGQDLKVARKSVVKLQDALARFRRCRILVVGDLILDTYVYGETVRVSREAPVLVVRRERSEHRLGGAANAAANLAALGVDTLCVGAIGTDPAGQAIIGMLKKAGVQAEGICQAEIVTPQKTRILAGAHGTARQQVLRIDDEPSGLLSQQVIAHIKDTIFSYKDLVDTIIISDYGAGSVANEIIAQVCELSAGHMTVCVDSRLALEKFVGVSAVTPNLPEAEDLVGFPLFDQDAVDKAGDQILKKLNCRWCLITQGRGGMTLFGAENRPLHMDIVGGDEVTDVTGAGDTVMATFGAALTSGLGPINGMRLAMCAAGVAVMRMGTTTVSPEEILAAAENSGLELEAWEK